MESDDEGASLIEKAIRYANKMQQEEDSAQASLFGGGGGDQAVVMRPRVVPIEPYGEIEKLNIEREMVGLYITGHPLDEYKFEMNYLTNCTLTDLKDLEAIKGRELRFGGVVSSVAHRTTKKGKPFGQFTLEDFNDNYSFFLFGQDYINFKPLLETGWFLYIVGMVQTRWNGVDLELKINQMEPLGEIRDKMAKGVELQMHLADVNQLLVNELEGYAQKYPGSCQFKVSVMGVYEDRPINLEMSSRKMTVALNDELLKELDKLEEIKYRVITA